MASRGGSEPPPPLPPDLSVFKNLVEVCSKLPTLATQEKFVKNMDSIPSVALPVEEPCRAALKVVERGLIGQFTGFWPSPKAIES